MSRIRYLVSYDICHPKRLRRVARALEGFGVRLQYSVFECALDAMRLAKKVDRKNLGVTFNLCHCLMVGDEAKIPELLTEAAPYLFLVTINGADTGAARTSWGRLIRPLDEGSFDVGTVLKQLKALKYEGPIGLQGYGVNLPPKTNLTRSMNAWKKLSTLDP